MARTRFTLCISAARGIVALVVCVLLGGGCERQSSQAELAPPQVEFTHFGLSVHFSQPVAAERLLVRTSGGTLERELPLTGQRRAFDVPFDWQPGTTYVLEWQLADRQLHTTVTAPPEKPTWRGTLEAPWGQGGVPLGEPPVWRALLPEDGQLSFGLVLENLVQTPARFEIMLRPEQSMDLNSEDPDLQHTDAGDYVRTLGLNVQHDYAQVLGEARLRADADTARIEVIVRRVDAMPPEEQSITLELQRVSRERLRELIAPGNVAFPCDPQGRPRPERQGDTVTLPDAVWATVRRWLQPTERVFNFHGPYAYQGLPIENRSDVPLNLLLESEVVAASGDAPLLNFAPPVWAAPRESATAVHLLRVPPRETAWAVIPLFVRPETSPGDYVRQIRVSLAGSAAPLYSIDAPLRVVRGNPVVATVAAASLVVSAVAWLLFFCVGRRWIGSLGTTSLAVIGMLAALHFAVSFGSRIAGDVIAAVAGPFAIFLAGVGNEGLTCLVLAALVVLVPRPGTVTVSSLTVFLLNAMFSGQFGLLDVVFVTVSIVCNETLLALAGVTTRSTFAHDEATTFSRWSTRWRTAGAIGLANGLVLFAQFCLMQLLVRLFFATWYVTAVALIVGVLYGTIGALAGAALGQRLRSTAR
ncbi:MAG: phage holin family protein [Pirellulales bacterium]|nr:phage holin family protein [Pirellulales bacterium]